MATIAVTEETFESTITDNDIVLVDFWAEWCGPCRSFAPTFESASESHPDIVFAKVDTEDQQRLAGSFGIRSIPTLMVFRDNVIIYKEAGALPGPMLENLIQQVRDVDMDEVHRQIAERSQQESKHAPASDH